MANVFESISKKYETLSQENLLNKDFFRVDNSLTIENSGFDKR